MKKCTTAVIMAGGFGTRLASVTGSLPKAMVNIYNTGAENYGKAKDTILEHQMRVLSENGINNFILVVGNKKEFIKEAFTDKIINQNIPGRNISIKFFEEESPLGTGGAFCSKALQKMIKDEDFLFTYSDVLFDVNVQQMYQMHSKEKADATVLISPCSDPDDRPLCVCKNGSSEIVSIMPKQGKTDGPRGDAFPNTPKNGLMFLNKSIFKLLPQEPTYLDMEESILTRLIYSNQNKVVAWNSPCYVKDIGTVDRYYEGVNDLFNNIPQLKNPNKNPQHCVVFSERELIGIVDNKAAVDTTLTDAIVKFNKEGIITVLKKDSPVIDNISRGDMIVDTLLIRQGSGAYINSRFEEKHPEQFFETMQEWNIPKDNVFMFTKIEKGILVRNAGTRQAEICHNPVSATYNILEQVTTEQQQIQDNIFNMENTNSNEQVLVDLLKYGITKTEVTNENVEEHIEEETNEPILPDSK